MVMLALDYRRWYTARDEGLFEAAMGWCSRAEWGGDEVGRAQRARKGAMCWEVDILLPVYNVWFRLLTFPILPTPGVCTRIIAKPQEVRWLMEVIDNL